MVVQVAVLVAMTTSWASAASRVPVEPAVRLPNVTAMQQAAPGALLKWMAEKYLQV
jgi:hypothetical protein